MSAMALSFLPGGGVQPNPPIRTLVTLTDKGAYRIVKSHVLLSEANKSPLMGLAHDLGIAQTGNTEVLRQRIKAFVDQSRWWVCGFRQPERCYQVELVHGRTVSKKGLSSLDVGDLGLVARVLGLDPGGTRRDLHCRLVNALGTLCPIAFPLYAKFDPKERSVATIQLYRCTYYFKIGDALSRAGGFVLPKSLSEASAAELVQVGQFVGLGSIASCTREKSLQAIKKHLDSSVIQPNGTVLFVRQNAGPTLIGPPPPTNAVVVAFPRKCAFPAGCSYFCDIGCSSYCSRCPLHQKYEALLRYYDFFYAQGDGLGCLLALCLLEDLIWNKKNNGDPMQPSIASLRVILQYFDCCKYSTKNLFELYMKLKKYLPMLLLFNAQYVRCDSQNPSTLYALDDLNRDCKVLNRRERAKKFAECVIKQGFRLDHQKLVVLDGRGSMILLILEEIFNHFELRKAGEGKEVLMRLKLEWVEKDHSMNVWHEKLFHCDALTCTHADVFDLRFQRTDLVYLNLHGVTDSFERLIYFLRSVQLPVCMVSFSTARASKAKNFHEMFLQLFVGTPSLGRVSAVEFSAAAMREDFSTFVVEKILCPILQQKCDSLVRFCDYFFAKDDKLGYHLAWCLYNDIFESQRSGGPVQPSVTVLKVMQQCEALWQSSMSENLYELLKLWNENCYLSMLLLFIAKNVSYDGKNIPTLEDLCHDDGVSNLRERAKIFAKCFDRKYNCANEHVLVVLDDHGAMVLLILKEIFNIQERRGAGLGQDFLERLKLQWVSRNESVCEWHKMLFRCDALKCLGRLSIFDCSLKSLTTPQHVHVKKESSSLDS